MTNEKLIEWARSGNHLATRPGLVLELADALEAAEKALTPTDDEPVAYAIYGRATGNLKYVQIMDAHEVDEQSEFYDVAPLFHQKVAVEPQGEPSDAQVQAALRAYWGGVENARSHGSAYGMRAALRAAGEVRS